MYAAARGLISSIFVLAFTLSDAVQLTGFLILCVTFLAVGRVRNKDATIKTWRENAEAEAARADRLEDDIAGCVERADREHERRTDAERLVARLQGQLEELRPYGESFKALTARLEHTESVLGTALQAHGELIQKNAEIGARVMEAVEHVSADQRRISENLGRLAERLGAGGDRPIGSV